MLRAPSGSLLSPPALVILVEDALALLHLQVQVVKDAGQVHQAVVCKCAQNYIYTLQLS